MIQVQIFYDKDKFKDNKPLTEYILQFLVQNQVMGATVFRGETGFGHGENIKRPDLLFSFDDPSMLITFVDEDEKVKKVLTAFRKKVKSCFIILHQVERWN